MQRQSHIIIMVKMCSSGAISISKMMMKNHSLQKLYLWENSIGDNGISAIAGVLNNTKIIVLSVRKCGITFAGAKSLAAALIFNHNIKELRLSDNDITVEGALLIVKSAVENTVCQHVSINDEYKSDEVKKMMIILKDRKRQHVSDCVVQCAYFNILKLNNILYYIKYV